MTSLANTPCNLASVDTFMYPEHRSVFPSIYGRPLREALTNFLQKSKIKTNNSLSRNGKMAWLVYAEILLYLNSKEYNFWLGFLLQFHSVKLSYNTKLLPKHEMHFVLRKQNVHLKYSAVFLIYCQGKLLPCTHLYTISI